MYRTTEVHVLKLTHRLQRQHTSSRTKTFGFVCAYFWPPAGRVPFTIAGTVAVLPIWQKNKVSLSKVGNVEATLLLTVMGHRCLSFYSLAPPATSFNHARLLMYTSRISSCRQLCDEVEKKGNRMMREAKRTADSEREEKAILCQWLNGQVILCPGTSVIDYGMCDGGTTLT